MSGASVRTGTRIPRNLLATIGLQVLRMLRGDHLGVDFPGARQIRSLAERTRTSPGAVLLCATQLSFAYKMLLTRWSRDRRTLHLPARSRSLRLCHDHRSPSLHRHTHVYPSIETLTLRVHTIFITDWSGWYFAWYHNCDIDNPLTVLVPVGAPRSSALLNHKNVSFISMGMNCACDVSTLFGIFLTIGTCLCITKRLSQLYQ